MRADAEFLPSAPVVGTMFLTDDHLGSNRVVTDGNENVIARHDYLPFGEEITDTSVGARSILSVTGSTDSSTQRFTGTERDAETGLDFMQARYHSSAQGRLMSPDPVFASVHQLFDPQQWNLYAYVRNSPLVLTDRTGLDFYLSCTPGKGDTPSDTCQQVENGNSGQRIWVQGQLVDGNFQALDIDMNRDGSGLFSDQFGRDYTGSFDQNGVQFSSVDKGGPAAAGHSLTGATRRWSTALVPFTVERSRPLAILTGAVANAEQTMGRSWADLFNVLGDHPQPQYRSGASHLINFPNKRRYGSDAGKTEIHFEGHSVEGADVVTIIRHMVDAIHDLGNKRPPLP